MDVRTLLMALALFGYAAADSRAAVLYDGTSAVTPNGPPWAWAYQTFNKNNPLTTPSLATQTPGPAAVTLNTTAESADVAGYLTHLPNLGTPGDAYLMPDLPLLDAAAGFEVQFSVRVASESHVSADRAGFSVIALANDAAPLGIELGFWSNEIWAQTATFTHDAVVNVAFDTTTTMVDYRLNVLGGGFTLWADGLQILSGALRDYSAFSGGVPGNPGFPYDRPNLLFFGDNTSSAAATIELARIAVVPEPATHALACLALLAMGVLRTRVQR